ncbi:MAG: MoaD/ThiS family protein [Lachnospiraceae bacterium]|nr:MoaD/ThiS family protein [Lachnospiraceae bacterium]
MIEIRLFATLRQGREKIYHEPAEKFQTGRDIIEYYQISQNDVSIFLINGIHSKLEDAVKAEDVIAIFPPVGGG